MTDREIVDRLAKWMGWTRMSCRCCFWKQEGGRGVRAAIEWNPIESLDDCRVVEDEIERRGMSSIYRNHMLAMGYKVSLELIFITARQRCEAVLRVIGEE